MEDVMRLRRTPRPETAAYQPQTNGLKERLTKAIADMLWIYVDVEHKTRDTILLLVTFAYKTAEQDTTAFTIFRLVHGRQATTVLDANVTTPLGDDNDDDDAFQCGGGVV